MKRKTLLAAIMLSISIISFIAGTQTNTENHLNMKTITDYTVSEDGIMLYINDGSGYWIEK